MHSPLALPPSPLTPTLGPPQRAHMSTTTTTTAPGPAFRSERMAISCGLSRDPCQYGHPLPLFCPKSGQHAPVPLKKPPTQVCPSARGGTQSGKKCGNTTVLYLIKYHPHRHLAGRTMHVLVRSQALHTTQETRREKHEHPRRHRALGPRGLRQKNSSTLQCRAGARW